MAVIGYVRVNAAFQNLDQQIEAIGAVDRLFIDEVSSKGTHRPQFDALRAYLVEHSKDVVRMKSVDFLARSTRELLELLQEFEAKGVDLDFVDTPVFSTGKQSSKCVIDVLTAVVEFEHALIKERRREGVALAKARGKYQRAPKLTPEQIEEGRWLVEQGVPKTRVAERLGVSRWTLADALAGKGVYESRKRLEIR